jgi:hypothetical protein
MHASEIKAQFEMWNKHPNEAKQSSLLNRAETLGTVVQN